MHGGLPTSRHTAVKSVPGPAEPTVLIVEDERVSRRALSTLLASCGFRASAFESAEDALEAMRGHPMPDVVLVDVDLPGMSGLELVANLEKIWPDVKAVLITAAEGQRIDAFRREHGKVHYLRKPLDFPRLLRFLGGSRDGARTADC
jgi:CheY-like chemotaxis protein